MHGSDLLILSAVLVAGFVCHWLAWRSKLPSILFLLSAGIIAGPLFGWLQPDRLLGDLLQPVVSLAVAVILYEGAMTLRLSEIRGHGNIVRNLVTVGMLVTWAAASFAAWAFIGWDIYLSSLFGAIVTVSGPTVIMPLLRTIRPTSALSNVFRWEGILVDPLGAILAVLVFNFILAVQASESMGQLVSTFGLILLSGVGFGVAFGHALGVVLRKHLLPDYLRDYGALATVILVFSLAEAVEPESGLLAVTIMGVWQANMPGLDLDDILDFKESLTLVLVAGVFILLAARLDLDALIGLGAGAAGVLLFLQLVAGPVRAFVSGAGSDFSWRERLFLGWLFPRGIVAAAVSSLFALRLESIGYPNADDLVPMVFTIIIGTVILQSFTGRLLANWLGVSTPEPTGVLVVGANPVALTFASALQTAGHRVTVSSLNWKGISKARMAKLNAFYGSAVSSYADRHLDLTGIGHLVALSDRPDLNELACVRYRYEFGRGAVYTIKQHSEAGHEKFQITGETSGRVLFGGEHSIDDLMKLVAQDVEIHTTEITDAFGFDDYQQRYPERLVLFASNQDGRLRFPLGDEDFDVRPGWRVSAIGPAGKENGHAAEPHGRGDEGALPVNG